MLTNRLKPRWFAGSILCLMVSALLWADDSHKKKLYWEVLRNSPNYIESHLLSPSKEWKVRLGFRLDLYETVTKTNRIGVKETRSTIAQTIKEVLRVHLGKVNHFYFDQYHVQTIPQDEEARGGDYDLTLVVFKRYGKTGALEEKLGSFHIPIDLDKEDKEDKEVASYQGLFHKTVQDSLGYPKISLKVMNHKRLRTSKS